MRRFWKWLKSLFKRQKPYRCDLEDSEANTEESVDKWIYDQLEEVKKSGGCHLGESILVCKDPVKLHEIITKLIEEKGQVEDQLIYAQQKYDKARSDMVGKNRTLGLMNDQFSAVHDMLNQLGFRVRHETKEEIEWWLRCKRYHELQIVDRMKRLTEKVTPLLVKKDEEQPTPLKQADIDEFYGD